MLITDVSQWDQHYKRYQTNHLSWVNVSHSSYNSNSFDEQLATYSNSHKMFFIETLLKTFWLTIPIFNGDKKRFYNILWLGKGS